MPIRIARMDVADTVMAAALILLGAGLLFYPAPLTLDIGFPVELPAMFVIPPPYPSRWLPVVDGVSLGVGAVRALGLALAGTGLGLLLAGRRVRALSTALFALFLWHIEFWVEVHPGDHELVRPYVLVALLLALSAILGLMRNYVCRQVFD